MENREASQKGKQRCVLAEGGVNNRHCRSAGGHQDSPGTLQLKQPLLCPMVSQSLGPSVHNKRIITGKGERKHRGRDEGVRRGREGDYREIH